MILITSVLLCSTIFLLRECVKQKKFIKIGLRKETKLSMEIALLKAQKQQNEDDDQLVQKALLGDKAAEGILLAQLQQQMTSWERYEHGRR